MKKKLFAIPLSIVMVAGLLPVTALAAEPTVYDIWVDGVQVTSENKDNLSSGTVSYDPTTHTFRKKTPRIAPKPVWNGVLVL